MLGRLAQIGDSGVCTTPMCTAGVASIQEMDTVYQSLNAPLQSVYQSAHDSIMATYQDIYHWYDSWVPFNSVCCTMQELGAQADQLTAQMQASLGQVPSGTGPGTAAKPGSFLNLLGDPGTLLIFGLVAFFIFVPRR